MITVEEAVDIILNYTRDFGTEKVPLADAGGRVLRETIKADRDFPPFDRVTMDGIAIRYDQFEAGQREYLIEGTAAAGAPEYLLKSPNHCLEVMTGAMLPKGTDTVIRYEDVSIANGTAVINISTVKPQQNVHFKGSDQEEDTAILEPGVKISSAEIGVCATVGKVFLEVSRLPKVIIISTGDELINVDESPEPHQIRKSNVHQLQHLLKSHGIMAEMDHLMDDYSAIKAAMEKYVSEYDAIILSGGVSKGKFDFLPKVLEEIEVKKHFHKIKQRPGKPFWFGTHSEDCVVFALPGNPVSSFMCFQRYFVPWLKEGLKENLPTTEYAALLEDVHFQPDLTYFLQVKLTSKSDGTVMAKPEIGNGSGDLANLVYADAFIELPRTQTIFKKGEAYAIYRYRY